jgi:hypothetical protein
MCRQEHMPFKPMSAIGGETDLAARCADVRFPKATFRTASSTNFAKKFKHFIDRLRTWYCSEFGCGARATG